MSTPSQSRERAAVSVRPMREADLREARRIVRVAFGTYEGAPDPENAGADREFAYTRWRAYPQGALAAEWNGVLVGSNFATRWGSFGFFGPLTVRPDLWDRGVAQALLAPTVDLFTQWGVRQAGLYTFANSPKHIALYQKFGFWPRSLTAILSRTATAHSDSFLSYSALAAGDREQALSACRDLTDSIYEGLDVTPEIRAVQDQNLGETVLLWGGATLDGFAVCHCGESTEAGRDRCYVKFAAVRRGPGADGRFDRILDACETLAAGRRLQYLTAGVSLARRQAYRQMLRRGFRTDQLGVAMHNPDSPAYNRPNTFVLDDWR